MFVKSKNGETLLKIDPCDACLSPENFYLYASNRKYSMLEYTRKNPCNYCDHNPDLKKVEN
jgi:hypothetical protein